MPTDDPVSQTTECCRGLAPPQKCACEALRLEVDYLAREGGEYQEREANLHRRLIELELENQRLQLAVERLRAFRNRVKDRTPYPLFCHQPEKCAGSPACRAEIVCND